MVLSLKNFPSQKCRGEGILAKNAVFCNFPLLPQEIFQVAANRTILILEGLPMAHLKAFVPYFQKHMLEKVLIFKIVGASPLRTQVIQNLVHQNSCF